VKALQRALSQETEAEMGRTAGRIVVIVLFSLSAGLWYAAADSPIEFWDIQRKGANFFNKIPAGERFEAAQNLGLDFIRLVPDKWQSAGRDFLLGSADHFEALNDADYRKLQSALDEAHQHGCKVILGMLSLPGARWKQNNDDKDDGRLWHSEEFQQQARRFWRELAERLKDHPAVIAYNPLNEPHPARGEGIDGADHPKFEGWLDKNRGGLGDLDRFYDGIVKSIRTVDPSTPILIEGYGHGSASGLAHLAPINDPGILYSFHYYEPWNYTAKRANKGKYSYPDEMPAYWNGPGEKWTIENLRERMEPVVKWAAKHAIPSSRIVAAEFGCSREVSGAQAYLTDVIDLLNRRGYHWAFYSYREDVWNGMDYELGTEPLEWNQRYWDKIEQGIYAPKAWHDNSLFQIIKKEFAE
jgi:hypothetical protein